MALIYDASLVPSKPELLAAWLPRQEWMLPADRTAPITVLGAYRFDDPYGEVGIETHLVQGASGTVYQVPLTYRGAPLPNAARYLVSEMEHSELGHRWVYDGPADPVYAPALVACILSGGEQAPEHDPDGNRLPAEVTVRGTGDIVRPPVATLVDLATEDAVTTIQTDSNAVRLLRVVGDALPDRLRLDALTGLEGAPRTLAAIVTA